MKENFYNLSLLRQFTQPLLTMGLTNFQAGCRQPQAGYKSFQPFPDLGNLGVLREAIGCKRNQLFGFTEYQALFEG